MSVLSNQVFQLMRDSVVFLSDCSFSIMGVPPSLLACGCLCDAIKHLDSKKHSECVEILSRLANLEQVSVVILSR